MKKVFLLKGLDCANCAAKIESNLQRLPGVTAATVNFMTARMTLEADREAMPAIVEQASAIVRKIEPDVVITKA